MPNEIKYLTVSPSIKNWPVALGAGAFIALTGFVMMVLTIVPVKIGLAVAAAGFVIMVPPFLKASTTVYSVSNLRVSARRGILSKVEAEVPIAGIQDVRVARAPRQASLGVGDVEVVCAEGTLVFEGLEEPEKVRQKILSLR